MRDSERAGLIVLIQSGMNKLQKIIFVAVVLALVAGFISRLVSTVKKQKERIEMLDRNVSALISSEKEYVTKLGDAAVKRKAIEASYKDLKGINEGLYKDIKALEIRLKDALSATRIVTKTEIREVVRVDTIDNRIVAEYSDPWNTIKSEMANDTARLSYSGRDSITGVISIKRKRFLFFRYGVKSVDYDVSNKNPKTKINIQLAIKFK